MTASERIREARSNETRESWGFLIVGRSRTEIAGALVEYRAFARNNPDNPLGVDLLDTAHKMILGLKERRGVNRAIGMNVKGV